LTARPDRAGAPRGATEDKKAAIVTAAIKEARKSMAALLLELPREVWVAHKGAVENAIALMVAERREMQDEAARLAAGARLIAAACAYVDFQDSDAAMQREQWIVEGDALWLAPYAAVADDRAALGRLGAEEETA